MADLITLIMVDLIALAIIMAGGIAVVKYAGFPELEKTIDQSKFEKMNKLVVENQELLKNVHQQLLFRNRQVSVSEMHRHGCQNLGRNKLQMIRLIRRSLRCRA